VGVGVSGQIVEQVTRALMLEKMLKLTVPCG
jgi:hypothetical protein